MKILALESERADVKSEDFTPHLTAEATAVWKLYQAGIFRELYFHQDKNCAVIVLECEDAHEAGEILNTLPIVKEGLITFDIIPLRPYPGFSRIFGG